jgi:hypothetical protein
MISTFSLYKLKMEIIFPPICNKISYDDEIFHNEVIHPNLLQKLSLIFQKMNEYNFNNSYKYYMMSKIIKKYIEQDIDIIGYKIIEIFSKFIKIVDNSCIYIYSDECDSIYVALNYYYEKKDMHFTYECFNPNSMNNTREMSNYNIIFYNYSKYNNEFCEEFEYTDKLITCIKSLIQYLQINGSLIINFISLFESRTLYFIYHLCAYFDCVKFYNSEISEPSNIGGFLICTNYKGNFTYFDKKDSNDLFSKFIISTTSIINNITSKNINDMNDVINGSEYSINTKKQSERFCNKWIKKYIMQKI